ncbi:MAG TPA: C39 family peptidase [Candidatus Acidoferrales bacterium]|nr:C39 family peptidase [Candidatus Acidoferrales bacterium]
MKLRTVVGLLVVSTVCAACVFAAQTAALWIDVPFVAQSREGCGSASISMVMRYWAKKKGQPSPPSADPQKIQAALFSPESGGISASSMQRYFRESGYRAFAFQAQWSDLVHHLQLGRPLIVSLDASGPLGPLHYVVLVGIDPARGFLFLNDPAQRKMLRISRKGFQSEWSHTGNWALLAVPSD